MEEGGGGNNSGGNNNNSTISISQHQQHHQKMLMQQQHQQQLYLFQQYQQHQQQQQQQQQQSTQQSQHNHLNLQQSQQQHQQQQQHLNVQHQQQQQQQQAINRFPSNIDAHLRSPGLRSLHLNHLQQQNSTHQLQNQLQNQNQIRAPPPARGSQPPPVEVEMALQDAMKVCNPDIKNPFSSIEDAVFRLLPYHVVSDFEAEEDDRILDSDSTGQIPSRLQQWDHNILSKIAEFTTTFEKQVLAFNIMSRKRAQGEFRSEERLMIEQALLHEEKRAVLEARAEIESREKNKMQFAMAHAEAQDMFSRAPIRGSAIGPHPDDGPGPELGGNGDEMMMQAWGNNAQREEDDPSEDFLNDENEPENGDANEDWRESGELDLNAR